MHGSYGETLTLTFLASFISQHFTWIFMLGNVTTTYHTQNHHLQHFSSCFGILTHYMRFLWSCRVTHKKSKSFNLVRWCFSCLSSRSMTEVKWRILLWENFSFARKWVQVGSLVQLLVKFSIEKKTATAQSHERILMNKKVSWLRGVFSD